jgi:hypothetical protein
VAGLLQDELPLYAATMSQAALQAQLATAGTYQPRRQCCYSG